MTGFSRHFSNSMSPDFLYQNCTRHSIVTPRSRKAFQWNYKLSIWDVKGGLFGGLGDGYQKNRQRSPNDGYHKSSSQPLTPTHCEPRVLGDDESCQSVAFSFITNPSRKWKLAFGSVWLSVGVLWLPGWCGCLTLSTIYHSGQLDIRATAPRSHCYIEYIFGICETRRARKTNAE